MRERERGGGWISLNKNVSLVCCQKHYCSLSILILFPCYQIEKKEAEEEEQG